MNSSERFTGGSPECADYICLASDDCCRNPEAALIWLQSIFPDELLVNTFTSQDMNLLSFCINCSTNSEQ